MRDPPHTPEVSVPGSGPGLRPRPIPPMASPLLPGAPPPPPPPPPPPGPPPPPPPPAKAFKIRKHVGSSINNDTKPEIGKLPAKGGDFLSELTKKMADGVGLKKSDPSALQRPGSTNSVPSFKPDWLGKTLKKTSGVVGHKGRSLSSGEMEKFEKSEKNMVQPNEAVHKRSVFEVPVKKDAPPPTPPLPKPEQPAVPVQTQPVKKEGSTFTAEKRLPSKPIPKASAEISREKSVAREVSPMCPAGQPTLSKLEDKPSYSYKERPLDVEHNWWVLWIVRWFGFIMMVYSLSQCERLMRLSAVANGVMEGRL